MPHPTSKTRALLDRWFTISNALTVSRIAFTPFIVNGMIERQWGYVFALFFVAALTDVLDGYFARLLDEPTALGTWLDPVADKCLILSCFITLAFLHFPTLGIPLWFVTLFVVRELILVVGTLALLILGRRVTIKPNLGGKLTTFFQLVFIGWLFLCYFFGWSPHRTYFLAMGVLSLFAVGSLLGYIRVGVGYIKD